MFQIAKLVWFWCCLVCSLSLFAQRHAALKPFIPFDSVSIDEIPIKELKVDVRVMHYSEDDPRNITIEDTAYLNQQFKYINQMLRTLTNPTRPVSDTIPVIHDSRFRIKLNKLYFHVDSVGWLNQYVGVVINRSWPKEIVDVDLENNSISIAGNYVNSLKRRADSLQIASSTGNDAIYHIDTLDYKEEKTCIRFKEPLHSGVADGKITYFKEYDKNCSKRNYDEYCAKDNSVLTVFYTGSASSTTAYGCGPSPYYLNFCNVQHGGDWANAQLLLHEIGHTIGLSHTNRPQFNDLPKTDKFCFCDCNDKDVSNNIMGYNVCRSYLSPFQLGHVHRKYTVEKKRISLTTRCDFNPNEVIWIDSNTVWDRNKVVNKDIVVTKWSTLEITEDIGFAEGVTIYLEKRSALELKGAKLTNRCGGRWIGVKKVRRYGGTREPWWGKGKVIIDEQSAIEGTR